MDKIQWFGSTNETCRGFVLPHFKIYRNNGKLILFIFDDRPKSIPIKSVRQGKVRAKKYLDAKIYEKFGE
jgi:hypothetical protein